MGSAINSVIIGSYNNKIYRVDYLIKTNEHWETIFFEIKTQVSDKRDLISYQSDGKGNWTKNGTHVNEFKDCIDIDISLTPFTNTLSINRIKLRLNETKEIKVLYLDILNQQIKSVKQIYTRLSQFEYKYENVPNDFEAIITVDELGLVVNYPGLFARTEKRESNYE